MHAHDFDHDHQHRCVVYNLLFDGLTNSDQSVGRSVSPIAYASNYSMFIRRIGSNLLAFLLHVP